MEVQEQAKSVEEAKAKGKAKPVESSGENKKDK